MHFYFFFFTASATTEIYTLSLHDALPIFADDSGIAEQFADLLLVVAGDFSGIKSVKHFAVPRAFPQDGVPAQTRRSEEHTSELQSHSDLVCRLLLEKKKHKPI